MNILIAGSVNNYSCYEEELLTDALSKELKKLGYKVDYFLLPYKNQALTILDQILAYRLLDVSAADLLITIGYPACMINHSNKITYLLETAPMFHEYWDTEYGIYKNHQYLQILTTLNNIETNSLSQAKKVYCASKILSDDIKKRCNVNTEYLAFPLLDPKEITNEILNDKYFIVETNLLQNSRYFEFVEQIPKLKAAKVYFFIPNSDPVYIHALSQQIQRLKLSDKLSIISGEPSDNVLINSNGYLCFGYHIRRYENILNRCAALGVPIIMTEDCGAPMEISKSYKSVYTCDFETIISTLNDIKIKSVKLENIISISEFTKGMVNI